MKGFNSIKVAVQMAKKWRKFPVLLLILVVISACERGSRDYAATKEKAGYPQYHQDAVVYSTPGPVNMPELVPVKGAIDGKALFNANCAACHQVTGAGVPGAFPPLDGSPFVTGDNFERMASIMLYGLMGEIEVKGNKFNGVMLPQKDILKDEELAAVANYIRNSWSNKAPEKLTPDIYKKMREKWGTRAQFNIAELGPLP